MAPASLQAKLTVRPTDGTVTVIDLGENNDEMVRYSPTTTQKR